MVFFCIWEAFFFTKLLEKIFSSKSRMFDFCDKNVEFFTFRNGIYSFLQKNDKVGCSTFVFFFKCLTFWRKKKKSDVRLFFFNNIFQIHRHVSTFTKLYKKYRLFELTIEAWLLYRPEILLEMKIHVFSPHYRYPVQ